MRKKQIGNALLIHGDAFLLMPTLGDVDCILTDPPYNAKTHRGARSAKSLAASQIDFEGISEEQFIEFCGNAVAQSKRWVVMSCHNAVKLRICPAGRNGELFFRYFKSPALEKSPSPDLEEFFLMQQGEPLNASLPSLSRHRRRVPHAQRDEFGARVTPGRVNDLVGGNATKGRP